MAFVGNPGPPHPQQKEILKRVIFLLKPKTDAFTKSPRIKKIYNPWKLALAKLNDSTVYNFTGFAMLGKLVCYITFILIQCKFQTSEWILSHYVQINKTYGPWYTASISPCLWLMSLLWSPIPHKLRPLLSSASPPCWFRLAQFLFPYGCHFIEVVHVLVYYIHSQSRWFT